jgi:signal transduction histidine kinase
MLRHRGTLSTGAAPNVANGDAGDGAFLEETKLRRLVRTPGVFAMRVPNPKKFSVTAVLAEQPDTRVSRAVRIEDARPVILKQIRPGAPPSALARLEHELEFQSHPRSGSVLEAYTLETFRELPTLVLEDFGGRSLDELLAAPLPVDRFLELAIPIAGAVADVHRLGIVHRDLKPSNILLNTASGETKIADFGIASRAPREQPLPRRRFLIEGSLAYMSPEQTGRLDRAVDSRSDLYSLGVTFYRMLTGALPFDAQDPMEWVHGHIALTPLAPDKLVPGLPRALSDIVLKLLAKEPEDRYQSALGLKRDLEEFQRRWANGRRIEPFLLDKNGRSELSLALSQALEGLRLLGIDLPAHPTKERVRAEYEEVSAKLGAREIASLLDLPLVAEGKVQAALRILSTLRELATDPDLVTLHVCRMVNLCLEHGNTDASVYAYGAFGVLLCLLFDRYDEGLEFGKLGLRLAEKHGYVGSLAQAHLSLGRIAYWTQPIPVGIHHAAEAFDAGIQSGDNATAGYACALVVADVLARGDRLEDVLRESEERIDRARQAKQPDAAKAIIETRQYVQNLRGLTTTFSSLSDSEFDEDDFERNLGDNATTLCWHAIWKLQARVMSGDFQGALAASPREEELFWASPSPSRSHDYRFYHSLALAGSHAEASPRARSENVGRLREHAAQLAEWSRRCPSTFSCTHALVAAELARIEGRTEEAMRSYEDAIRSAREHGVVQNEAIAYEVASRFYRERGYGTFADAYVHEAIGCYSRWGAEGKARQLTRLFPHVAEPRALAPSLTFAMEAEQFDLLSVVKASQSISSQIELPKLRETLLRIVLEHAGAEKGSVVLAQAGAYTVYANNEAVPLSPAILPVSVIEHVGRTLETVILDATTPSPFSSDEYLVRERPRSMLCLPLVRRAEAVGMLYLENKLLAGAFSRDRLAVLELIATQAAVSIENASLYSQLQSRQQVIEEALRTRDTFLSVASHELRTPLTSLTLQVQSLRRALRDPRHPALDLERVAESLARADRQLSRLSNLVDTTLDISRLQTKGVTLSPERVDLGDIVREVLETLGDQLGGVTWLGARSATGWWDRLKLWQVVTNLVTNAIKFGARKPVEIVLEDRPESVSLSVRDHGIGIPPPDRERIFNAFERVASPRHYGGLGLGLYISRRFVEAHGGRLTVESEEGAGATFTVTLPHRVSPSPLNDAASLP